MSEAHARSAVYRRSKGVCEACGNWPSNSWHHRKNRSQGGAWTAVNGLHVCGDGMSGCHGWIGAHPTESYARGWLVRGSFDPAAIPVRYRGRLVLLDDDGDVTDVEGPEDDDHW